MTLHYFIAISDLHRGEPIPQLPKHLRVLSQSKLAEKLIKLEPEAFFIAGDLNDYFWNHGRDSKEDLPIIKELLENDEVFNLLDDAPFPIYYIWGNTDILYFEKDSPNFTPYTSDIRKWFDKKFKNFNHLHMKEYKQDDVSFVGYDDANKATETSSGKCWKEETFREEFFPLIKKARANTENVIMVTHPPPYNTLDFSSFGSEHIGSKAILEIIEEVQPLVHVFGHVHYMGGYAEPIGEKTTAINVSSFTLEYSHDILFGQSSFGLEVDTTNNILDWNMIVPNYFVRGKPNPFVEYRYCRTCHKRLSPFARSYFKTCRVCIAKRRIEEGPRIKRDLTDGRHK